MKLLEKRFEVFKKYGMIGNNNKNIKGELYVTEQKDNCSRQWN